MKTTIRYFKRELITRLVAGGTIATLLIFFVRITDYFQGQEWKAIAITIFLSLLPFLFDLFTLLAYNRKYGMLKEVDELFKALQEVRGKSNKFIIKSAIHRVQKEKQTINDLLDGRISLPALRNYEYIREIFRRVLEDIMEEGDSYFTLSNIEFWTKEPFKHTDLQNFVERNIQVAQKKHCEIVRIIMVHRSRMPDSIASIENLEPEQIVLRDLVSEFLKTKLIEPGQLTMSSSIKTLFYVSDTTDEFSEPVPYGMAISENLRHVMLVKPHGLNDKLTKIDNPHIDIAFHSFSTQVNRTSNHPMDTMMEINNLSIKDSNAMSHDLHLLTSRIAEKLKYMSAKYDSQGDRIESELSALLESTNPKSKLLDMMDMRKVFGL